MEGQSSGAGSSRCGSHTPRHLAPTLPCSTLRDAYDRSPRSTPAFHTCRDKKTGGDGNKFTVQASDKMGVWTDVEGDKFRCPHEKDNNRVLCRTYRFKSGGAVYEAVATANARKSAMYYLRMRCKNDEHHCKGWAKVTEVKPLTCDVGLYWVRPRLSDGLCRAACPLPSALSLLARNRPPPHLST